MSGCPLILRREIKGERREQGKEEPGTLGVGGGAARLGSLGALHSHCPLLGQPEVQRDHPLLTRH